MENNTDLQARFDRLKISLTEQWADNGIKTPPTDLEVWGQMKAISLRHQEEALWDDMQGYVEMYSLRIQAIKKEMEKLTN